MQKEQLLEEAFEADSQVQLVNLERKGHSSSNSSGNSVTSSRQSLPSVVPKDLFAIYQNPKTDKMTYINTPFDKRQSKVTVQINKDFSNQIILHANPNSKAKTRKTPANIPVKLLLISPQHFLMI